MTKAFFKAEHRSVRAEARRRANATRSGKPGFASRLINLPGRGLISIRATRFQSRPPANTSTEAEVQYAVIIDRPIRQRIADDLRWAAVYRANAAYAHRQRDPHKKRISLQAARACISDARALMTVFARLPG